MKYVVLIFLFLTSWILISGVTDYISDKLSNYYLNKVIDIKRDNGEFTSNEEMEEYALHCIIVELNNRWFLRVISFGVLLIIFMNFWKG